MKQIIFKCEVITPMFCYGTDGETPDIRPPSIKGAFRFWWKEQAELLFVINWKKKRSRKFEVML